MGFGTLRKIFRTNSSNWGKIICTVNISTGPSGAQKLPPIENTMKQFDQVFLSVN